jgi:hypothetical protein
MAFHELIRGSPELLLAYVWDKRLMQQWETILARVHQAPCVGARRRRAINYPAHRIRASCGFLRQWPAIQVTGNTTCSAR